MNGVNDENCNWRINNQIESQSCSTARAMHAMLKQQSQVTKKVLCCATQCIDQFPR